MRRYFSILLPFLLIGCYFPKASSDQGKYQDELVKLEQGIDLARMNRDIGHLSLAIGPRPAGSLKANKAANWFGESLQILGYTPKIHSFKLPDGREAQNILCLIQGQSPKMVVIAAHLDTVEASPGANDDASGLALLLELARLIGQYKLKPEHTIMLAGFGAEEAIEDFSGHTYGSLSYLKSLTAEARKGIVGCIYLDKIGVGQRLLIRNIIFTNSRMAKFCRGIAETIGQPGEKLPLQYGWLLSRPMSFEKYGIPTAWIEWAPDPQMHKADDLPENIVGEKIMLVARIMLHLLYGKF